MTLTKAILATLAYHDVFDYPLTEDELFKYLTSVKCTHDALRNEFSKLYNNGKISHKDGYICLKRKNLSSIIKLRKLRNKYSKLKFKKAVFYSTILKIIPQIKLVALTGALAMENSHKADDIDLLILTAKNRLWTARFFSNLALWPWKRKPSAGKVSNKACLNIFIDESDLRIKEKNLYTAHEICQMRLLWDRDNAYMRFINANNWVKKYLPNWQPGKEYGIWSKAYSKGKKNYKLYTIDNNPVEILLKKFQMFYMKRRISTERIGETQLFFHPQDQTGWILSEYAKRLKKFNI